MRREKRLSTFASRWKKSPFVEVLSGFLKGSAYADGLCQQHCETLPSIHSGHSTVPCRVAYGILVDYRGSVAHACLSGGWTIRGGWDGTGGHEKSFNPCMRRVPPQKPKKKTSTMAHIIDHQKMKLKKWGKKTGPFGLFVGGETSQLPPRTGGTSSERKGKQPNQTELFFPDRDPLSPLLPLGLLRPREGVFCHTQTWQICTRICTYIYIYCAWFQ